MKNRLSIYARFNPAPGEGAVPPGVENGLCFVFNSGRLLVQLDMGRYRLPHRLDLPDNSLRVLYRHYLGRFENEPCLAIEAAYTNPPEGMDWVDLRQFYTGADEDLYLVAGRAYQILLWEQTHRFCGRCGHPTTTLPGEMAKTCPECRFTSYPRISPAVIVAVIKDDQILLTRYASIRGKWHTIIAGFLEPGETLEECVRREVNEEVGLQVEDIHYFGNQPWPFPNSLMVGFTARYAGGDIQVDGKEIAEAAWYSVKDIPEIPPKMSISREIIDWFRECYASQ